SVSAFVDGKYYVFDGWDAAAIGNPIAEVDIYDPVAGIWSQGAPNPVPAGGGSAIAVLNGLVYIVGGCNNGACGTPTDAVQVYHPASNQWSSAADYPVPVTWGACGGINGKLYCAGGMKATGSAITAGYVYDPASDSWSPISDIPLAGGLGGSFYSAANGLLLMAGGFEG